jgi:cytidine deaminase
MGYSLPCGHCCQQLVDFCERHVLNVALLASGGEQCLVRCAQIWVGRFEVTEERTNWDFSSLGVFFQDCQEILEG